MGIIIVEDEAKNFGCSVAITKGKSKAYLLATETKSLPQLSTLKRQNKIQVY